MTFTEAAIEVLRREGKPLHFKKIAEIAIRENLLDHVGKIPEETMADQLAAHCRQPRAERLVAPVQPGTFALVEWGLEEDPTGLESLVELPVEDELLYRGRERHPVPSRDIARSAGRGEGGRARRRDEEERRGRRFPPPAEVAYEILAGAGRPLGLVEIAAQGAERLLMPDAFVRDTASLQAALAEDNRRRESAGRKPLFQIEAEAVTLVAQPEPGERVVAAAPAAARAPSSPAEMRRAALAALRRRLRDCDGPTVEHVAGKLLEKLGLRDLKVAKRGREHVVYTGKRRMGLGDVRHAIRIVRGGADAGRRDVSDLRRDLVHYGAQIGLLVTPGDAAREARGEAGAAGQLPVLLLCGEALAEALADAGVGCVPIVVPEVDEAFFQAAAETAEKEEAARRARREERERRDQREPRQPAPERPAEVAADESAAAQAEPPAASEVPPRTGASPEPLEVLAELEDGGDGDDEGEDEGPEAAAAQEVSVPGEAGSPDAGAAGDRRRRRRRRRRRGGRGRGREGAAPGAAGPSPDQPGATSQPQAQGEGGPPPGAAAASSPREPEPAPAPAPEPPSARADSGDGGNGAGGGGSSA
ncbi:MAG TPA: HTH domain-containing protein [Anaeromyxobacter sp.]|nr:HTH domain-containing protein [Anaeromyxobacter sp.]